MPESELSVSMAPHLHEGASTRRIMLDVLLSLMPAVIAALVIFGARSFLLVCLSVAACAAVEFGFCKLLKKQNTAGDLSCAVTGMLLALLVPVSVNPLLILLGAVIAIAGAKLLFGGIGKNFVNPALAAWLVLSLVFPGQMTAFTRAFAYLGGADAATTATPLSGDPAAQMPNVMDLLVGVRSGTIGETCALALLLGGVYLIARRVISPVIPGVFLGTAALFSLFAGRNVIYELFSGGLLLGAIFMATDYTTSPVTTSGKVIYALGCGAVTMLVRVFTPLPEGVGYAILFMNLLVPLIERFTAPRIFGRKRRREKTRAQSGAAGGNPSV